MGEPVDLRIAGGCPVRWGGEPSYEPADINITAGRIVSLGGPPRTAHKVIDATGMLILPGMLNLHDHLRDLTPGIFDGLRLDDWLPQMWRLNELASPDEYRIGAALGAARLLKAGVTSVVDHLYPLHKPGLAQAAIEGYQHGGIRWFLARGIMTQGHPPICEQRDDALRAIRDLAGVVPPDRLLIAPVSFRQAAKDDYRAARVLADELNLRLYTHLAETSAEVQDCLSRHGARPVQVLDQWGFLGPDTVLVHCVLLSSPEIELLAGHGAHVVHCPSNHMKLAKGITPVPALLRAGVNVCLGIDMQNDMLTEIRQEMLLQGLAAASPGVIGPVAALRMATIGGAKALGLGHRIGSVEVGATADLVCVDQRDLALQPVVDPLWTVANRAGTHHVKHVVVDGAVAVHNGVLCRVDEEALRAEAVQITVAYLRRAGHNDLADTVSRLSALGAAPC